MPLHPAVKLVDLFFNLCLDTGVSALDLHQKAGTNQALQLAITTRARIGLMQPLKGAPQGATRRAGERT